MPKDFENCVSNGGRVRTKALKGGQYIKICYDAAGNSHAGEVKKAKSSRYRSKPAGSSGNIAKAK